MHGRQNLPLTINKSWNIEEFPVRLRDSYNPYPKETERQNQDIQLPANRLSQLYRTLKKRNMCSFAINTSELGFAQSFTSGHTVPKKVLDDMVTLTKR